MGAVEFGQLIKSARLRRGWQQQDVADRIGVDRGYISTIENGKRNWPQQYINPLSEVLGLDEVDMAIAAGLISPRKDRPTPPANPIRDQLIALIDDYPRPLMPDTIELFRAVLRYRAGPAAERSE